MPRYGDWATLPTALRESIARQRAVEQARNALGLTSGGFPEDGILNAILAELATTPSVQTFSVARFGAMSDGVTDSTTFIQAAIDAAVAAGGGRVLFDSGGYRASQIIIPNGVRLVGSGRHGGTWLKPTNSSVASAFITMSTGPVQDGGLEGFELRSNAIAGQHAILFKSVGIGVSPYHGGFWNGLLADLYLHDWLGHSLWLWGGGVHPIALTPVEPIQFSTFRNVEIQNASPTVAIVRLSGQCGQLLFQNCEFSGTSSATTPSCLLIERSRQANGITVLDDTGAYALHFDTCSFQQAQLAVSMERVRTATFTNPYFENLKSGIFADVTSENILVNAPRFANAGSNGVGSGFLVKANGQSNVTVLGANIAGTVDTDFIADSSSVIRAEKAYKGGGALTTSGISRQIAAAATISIGMCSTLIVNASATAITNITSGHAPGERISLRAHNGRIVLAASGNLELGVYGAFAVVPSGGTAVLVRNDIVDTWWLESIGSDSPGAQGDANVRTHGAVGNGVTSDATAVTQAAAAATEGGTLVFPPPSTTGYQIGTTELAVPAGVRVQGIARLGLAAQHPIVGTTATGLAIRANASGNVGPTAGHIFDSTGRVLYQPATQVFPGNMLPGPVPGEWMMVVMLTSGAYTRICLLRSVDDGQTWMQGQDILDGAPSSKVYIDPHMIRLSNGNLLCAFHESTSNGIRVYRSTDGGQTWTARTSIGPGAGEYLSEPFLLEVRNNIGAISNRVLLLYSNQHPTDTTIRDTFYQTQYTDNEGTAWTAGAVVTPTSGASSARHLNDGTRGAMYQTEDGFVQVLYSRKASGQPAEIWHERINALGAAPTGAPALVATVARISGAGATQVGPFPIAMKGRHGEYVCYYSGCNYENGGQTGELYFITSPTGARSSWGTKQRILTVDTMTGGYGRIWPCRMHDGRVELVHVAVPNTITGTQIRSTIHYGV